jgi:uncharacterized surface protein with fasciclin (FAS1) repeats
MKPKRAKDDPSARVNGRRSSEPNVRRPATRQGTNDSPYAENANLRDTCAGISRLQTFASAIDTAGLTLLLQEEALTVFAPTDRAFGKLPAEELNALLADKARLAELLEHHIVDGRVRAPRDKKPRAAVPRSGPELQLTSASGSYHVDQARIVRTNIRASNGVIHAIDTVLLPQ